MSIKEVVLVYGGELAIDVAHQLESKKPSSSSVSCTLRNASERPKTLLDYGPDVLVCFILQTIENGNPTEDGGACARFFKRKSHPEDLLNGKFSFAVMGLGDSNLLLDRQTTTAKDCNQCAEELHKRLLALGGTCAQELCMADERTELAEVEPWIELFWSKL
eukprot:scaffold2002_cov245-Chaetoceros_neogracile.AAC.6